MVPLPNVGTIIAEKTVRHCRFKYIALASAGHEITFF